MDPYQQPEEPTVETGDTQSMPEQDQAVEQPYQAVDDTLSQASPAEPVASAPVSEMTESFTPPVSETITPPSPEANVVTSTTSTETTTPVGAVVPVAKKSSLWLWLTLTIVVLALAAVLIIVYVTK